MDEAEKLIRPGMLVVDLGSAPGSWSQYLRNKLLDKGELRGRIIAMDILPMEAVPNVIFLQGDFREDEVLRQLDALVGEDKVDLVVSDMAPNLSGVESADMARIAHVCELALEFAQTHLKPEGALLVKAFHGSGYSQIVESFKRVFRVVKPLKPKASRDKSSETFLLGRVLK
jgi:23S rRNA (uridine2552-2'-O)-methyltransferase